MNDSNPVGTLQEHAQSKGGSLPLYNLCQALGESHCPNFTMEVVFGDLKAQGTASTKKLAKHDAARNMLQLIRGGNASFMKKPIETENGQENQNEQR